MRRGVGVVWFVTAVLATGAGTGACGGTPRAQPSASASAVDAGEVEQVAGDFSAVVLQGFESFPGATTLDPAQASLISPHAGFAFAGVATAPEITATEVAALRLIDPKAKHGLRPADGHEFLILRTADSFDTGDFVLSASSPATKVTIHSGDRDWPLTSQVSTRQTLVLSVLKGAETTLVLDDEGRTQTLNLRTGKRGPGAIPLYYPMRTAGVTGDLGCWAQVSGVVVPGAYQGNLVPVTGTPGHATLYPFYGYHGWARPGRAWLAVEVGPLSTMGEPVLTINAAASFTLTAGGKSIAPVADSSEIEARYYLGTPGETARVLFDVPETFRSGTISFAPHGKVSVTVGGAEKTGTFRPRTTAKPFTVQLPA